MKSIGICIGASTIKIVEIDEAYRISRTNISSHGCNPRESLEKVLQPLYQQNHINITLTGRKFKDLINLPSIAEPEATEYALRHYLKDKNQTFNALISLGSENFILYKLNTQGSIIDVRTGNKCASGAGEFFLQQIRRMNISVEESIELARNSTPYSVSGRCSVFCKSDCTHALNKGIPIGQVSAGLGNMVAEKVLELMKSIERRNILVVGGVTKNKYVMDILQKRIENLVIPDCAEVFEAWGAAIYALEHSKQMVEQIVIRKKYTSFNTLPSLKEAEPRVKFIEYERAIARDGDKCILGLDVGSTTTKAVLVRMNDNKICGSAYLRTNGNPVQAARECYKEIDKQLNNTRVKIVGLGVTGSGRQIAGLHALTDGIINEIIAHATGAAFFDDDVDTIIEIGGQDAKYTYLINGVPCDYAMNEACSAGTGSFLEEAAKESLDIDYLDIQDLALKATNPPNFNDQCAVFISSDIKNASHENISKEDIVGGLVYSICMNYNNRVRGERRIGNKIFMQGGVCYNRAVPLAMASLLNKDIIVPPEPGLIGAFGVALEIKNRLTNGLLKESEFSLRELALREVEYDKSFTCPGTKENCDRGCQINIININGKKYPFGGVCNKYYNTIHHISIDPKPFDLVSQRMDLIFEKGEQGNGPSIGLSKSFFTNTLFPLYYNFFTQLNCRIIIGDTVDPDGVKMTSSSFCFPAEIAHGMFLDLLKKNPDYIFLPHISELYVKGNHVKGPEQNCTCVIAQSEPYYLRSTFRNVPSKILSPVLNFSDGLETMENEFINIGKILGVNKKKSQLAFRNAIKKQKETINKLKELGKNVLKKIESDESNIGIVIFGRSYSAFADAANLGIPRKFASRGVFTLPFDCLEYDDEDVIENLTWATGKEIVKSARVVAKHPQLFGAYITNFSCGPDSFLIGYFRDIMNTKPSLTLELDSHTADAGINTRIEAFLDIIQRYRKIRKKEVKITHFKPAGLHRENGSIFYVSSYGEKVPIKDKRIKLIIPSMGKISSMFVAAAFRGIGFNAVADKGSDFQRLMLGRSNTSCKECLPLILTTASLLDATQARASNDELLLYFMPTAPGSCRFSQYYVFQKKLIEKKQLPNVALITLNAENSYAGLGHFDQIKILKAIMTADVFDDIRNALNVLAVDKKHAQDIFDEQFHRVIQCFEGNGDNLYDVLRTAASRFAEIKLRYPLSKAKKVLLTGEIYIRRDQFSSEEILKQFINRDIIVKRSQILEWLYYVDYIVRNLYKPDLPLSQMTELFIRRAIHHKAERKIKRILAKSGLYEYEKINIDKIVELGSKFINPKLTGEAILVVGSFFHDIIKHVHGVVSVGPFACMPTRVSESILNHESQVENNSRLNFLKNIEELRKYHTLPFLTVEVDGNPLPQIIEARIEAFALQVERIHRLLNHN